MMKKVAVAGLLMSLLAVPAALIAQGSSKATKEQQWLQQLTGVWEADVGVWSAPDKPPLKLKSMDNTRAIGANWISSVDEIVPAGPAGSSFARALLLGYDPQKQKYVATWVNSSATRIVQSEGTLDSAGKTLTLEGDMPSPFDPAQTAHGREVIEIQGPDQKVSTTFLQGPDGKWLKLVAITAKRKK